MRFFIILFFVFAVLIAPASAAYEYQETFTDETSLPTELTKITSGTYAGNITVANNNMTLIPGGAVSGVGVKNGSLWKHIKIDQVPHANGYISGYKYSCFGISNNGTVETSGTGGWNTYLKQGVYVTTGGTDAQTQLTLYEAWYEGETRKTKASTTVALSAMNETPYVLDLVVYENNSVTAYVDGVPKCTLASTNVTSGGVLIWQGAYDNPVQTLDIKSISMATTPQYVGEPPTIVWSSPDEVTTTQYDAVPTFSFTSDMPVNYTVTQNESSVSGSGTTYIYTPEYNGYGDYTATFNLEHPALLTPVTKTYTWHYTAAPTDQAPVLSGFSPASDLTIYQYQTVPFSTNVVGETDGYPLLSDVVWAVNGTTSQTNTSVTTADYDYTGSTVGDFLISADVTNIYGTDTESRTVTVLPNSMTISNMEYYPSGDADGTIIYFTASNFTAGIPIHGWAPSNFNQTVAGMMYTWSYDNLTVIDAKTATSDGEEIDFNLSTVPEGDYRINIVSEPVTDFSYTFRINGVQPVVSFVDQSVGGAATVLWDFGDDTTSTEHNPVHTYAAEGTYTVTLTVTNALGVDSKIVQAEILSSLLPATSFTKNTTGGFAPVTVQFNDTSTNATGWLWNFGDGYTTTAQNPTHTYGSEGLYTVTLTASNAAGTSAASDSIEIIKSANFTMSPETGTAPLTVKFTDTSINAESWRWDFENDGVIDSNMQNPLHTYGNVGYYPVNLSITTPDGNTSTIYYVNVNPTSITTLNQLWWFLHNLNIWVINPAVI